MPASDVTRIFHCNINCTNLERAIAFYEKLGFKVILDFRDGMQSQEMAEAFNVPVSDIRGVHLRIGDDDNASRIDLLEFKNPKPSGTPYPHLAHTGIARLCLKTSAIQKVYEDLRKEGIEFLSQPKKLPGSDVTIVCFRDPDGTFIELLQGDF